MHPVSTFRLMLHVQHARRLPMVSLTSLYNSSGYHFSKVTPTIFHWHSNASQSPVDERSCCVAVFIIGIVD